MINVEQLTILHAQVEEHLHAFSLHSKHKLQLDTLHQGRTVIAKYFKVSLALNTALQTEGELTEHLATTLKLHNKHMSSDAKKIVAFYIKFGHGCDKKDKHKFQKDLDEVVSLLKKHIKNEQVHLIPEYIMMRPKKSM